MMFIFLINRFIVSSISRKMLNFFKLARSFLIGATCRREDYRLVHVSERVVVQKSGPFSAAEFQGIDSHHVTCVP